LKFSQVVFVLYWLQAGIKVSKKKNPVFSLKSQNSWVFSHVILAWFFVLQFYRGYSIKFPNLERKKGFRLLGYLSIFSCWHQITGTFESQACINPPCVTKLKSLPVD
jgi:hypothetical protein